MAHTPGPPKYRCKRCGWEGLVKGRQRCLACQRRRTREWKQRNPEAAKSLKRRMDKKSRTERPEIEAAQKRRKRARNPTHYRAKYALRLAWLKEGDVTAAQLRRLFAASRGLCSYCGKRVRQPRFTSDPRGFDHIIPRSKGGKHTIANIVVCCRACNENKSDKAVTP